MFRILANCSPDTETVEKCTLKEDFIDRLKVSSYPAKVAAKIITNGIITHKRAEEREARNERNCHRLGEEGRKERNLKKISLKENWFRKKGNGTTLQGGDGVVRRQPMQNNTSSSQALPSRDSTSPRGGPVPVTGLPKRTTNTTSSQALPNRDSTSPRGGPVPAK